MRTAIAMGFSGLLGFVIGALCLQAKAPQAPDRCLISAPDNLPPGRWQLTVDTDATGPTWWQLERVRCDEPTRVEISRGTTNTVPWSVKRGSAEPEKEAQP